MTWSAPDYTASPDADECYKQVCRRKGLDFWRDGNNVIVDHNEMVMTERNGMVERSCADPKESYIQRNETDVERSVRDVDVTVSDDLCSFHVTCDVAQSIFQIATLARKKYAQHFHLGRKLYFTPAALLEKIDCDKADDKGIESESSDEENHQLLDTLHIKQGRTTIVEIAFILAIRELTGSSLGCTYICAPIPGRASYLLPRKFAKLISD